MEKILVAGAGGFIGSYLVRRLKQVGYWVRGVDIKRPQWSKPVADEFWMLDLRDEQNAIHACTGVDWVFQLAADMGGMGFISKAHAEIILNNTFINIHMIRAARRMGIKRYLFSSSACVYPVGLQGDEEAPLLKEDDAYPANPQDAYGWEKLHAEHVCKYFREAGWLDTRTVRFHNCYGPEGSWDDVRAKAPAALCRKVAIAKLTGKPEVEIWGDGQQRRSFMYIDDCTEGLLRLMNSDFPGPLNLGRDRAVTIDTLADIIAGIAGLEIVKKYVKGPQGVRSRNSDNSLCKEVLGWVPSILLEEGLVSTYRWIEEQVRTTL